MKLSSSLSSPSSSPSIVPCSSLQKWTACHASKYFLLYSYSLSFSSVMIQVLNLCLRFCLNFLANNYTIGHLTLFLIFHPHLWFSSILSCSSFTIRLNLSFNWSIFVSMLNSLAFILLWILFSKPFLWMYLVIFISSFVSFSMFNCELWITFSITSLFHHVTKYLTEVFSPRLGILVSLVLTIRTP